MTNCFGMSLLSMIEVSAEEKKGVREGKLLYRAERGKWAVEDGRKVSECVTCRWVSGWVD